MKSQKPCVEHCSWGKKAEKERRNHHHQWEAINGPREKKWMTEQGTTSKYALHGVDEGKEGREWTRGKRSLSLGFLHVCV